MKTAAVTLLGALAAMAAAQGMNSVPKCGEFCVNDMRNGKAASLGCDADDLACLCANKDFTYGLRDCSAATCPNQDARKIVEYGVSICKKAGVEITNAPGGSPTSTASNGGDGNGNGHNGGSGSVSTIYSTKTSDGSVITTAISTTTLTGGHGGDQSESASKTSSGSGDHHGGAVVTTITSDGKTITSTLSGTKTSGGSGAKSTTMATATSSGAKASKTGGSGNDNSSTEGGHASKTGDNSGSSETSTTGSGDAAPQRTAAPVGILAAAGLAALML